MNDNLNQPLPSSYMGKGNVRKNRSRKYKNLRTMDDGKLYHARIISGAININGTKMTSIWREVARLKEKYALGINPKSKKARVLTKAIVQSIGQEVANIANATLRREVAKRLKMVPTGPRNTVYKFV